jgi:hypothetical protein
MNIVRVGFVSEFRGQDVVLLAVDATGLDTFAAVVNQAVQQGFSRLDHGGLIHRFLVQDGAADIDLRDDHVVWRLDHAKLIEIIDKLGAMRNRGPGHHYVDDMFAPAETLVLSVDEYVYDPPAPPVKSLPPLMGSPAEPPPAARGAAPGH